ncbi:MAG: LysM peptidoglycan-binding domain-containing protein [Verrucomicrobiota bacterium]
MKVGSAVLGLHIAAIVAFSMTQGCITTEGHGSGRGAGARHRGIVKHQHKGNADDSQQAAASDSIYGDEAQDSVYDPVIIDSTSSAPQTHVAPSTYTGNTEAYIVQKGDILSQLAVDFNTSTKSLVEMNNLSNPDVLYVGQELRVPAGSRRSSSSSKSSSVKKGGEYVVQKGDTLSGIAVAADVSLADLRSLNNTKDDMIFAGETIYIPSGGKVPTNTQKSKPKKAEPVAEPEPAASEPAPAPMAEPELEPVETGSMQVDAVMDHVVYPGETLDDISRQYGVSKSDIMRLNNISDEFAVKEGQRLRIPIAE